MTYTLIHRLMHHKLVARMVEPIFADLDAHLWVLRREFVGNMRRGRGIRQAYQETFGGVKFWAWRRNRFCTEAW